MKKASHSTIDIPKPCNEMWDEMTPNERGRFCNACQKTVTDYTQMSDQQLLDIIKRGSMGCGRFLNTQLNRELIPERRQWQFFSSGFIKKIAAGLLILQTITRSAWAQNNIGEINGHVLDNRKVPITESCVELSQGTKLITSTVTDINGYFSLKNLPTDRYDLKIFYSKKYNTEILTGIVVKDAHPITTNMELAPTKDNEPETVVIAYRIPLPANTIPIDSFSKLKVVQPELNNLYTTTGFPQSSRDWLKPLKLGGARTDGSIHKADSIESKPTFWQRINIFRKKKR